MLRAASESSRSSYYSLHMEGSGKLELRWESNITLWSRGNQETVKKEDKIGADSYSPGHFVQTQKQSAVASAIFSLQRDHCSKLCPFLTTRSLLSKKPKYSPDLCFYSEIQTKPCKLHSIELLLLHQASSTDKLFAEV